MNRRRDRRLRIVVVLVAAVVVLGVGGFFGWRALFADDTVASAGSDGASAEAAESEDDPLGSGEEETEPDGSTGEPPDDVPAAVTDGFESTDSPGMGNGIGTGESDASVVVELYEDFMCPHCAAFEAQTAQALASYVESGDVRVVRYPMSLTIFGEPTELAANAYGCAADAARAEEYAAELFAASGTVWDTDALIRAAADAGLADDEFVGCVNEGGFEAWVASIDDAAAQRGVPATPTVFVNGEEVALSTTPLTEVEAAIEAALGGN